MAKPDVGFVPFFLMWARIQGWKVPLLHIRICHWLETCDDPVRVLQVFRGASKSTTYAVYKAWKLYRNRSNRALIWAADDPLATKLTRDTLNVMRRHPLCAGMLPRKPGAQSFWVNGATDARNPSMQAVGVNSNVTGARADDIDYDDIEVPKNIKTPEARANLRMKTEESTFIAVPGAQETYIGTPHTHDSIYPELIAAGAASLKIPLFENAVRYEDTTKATRYRFDFVPGDDGLYVMTGVYKHARLLVEGRDYKVDGRYIVFTAPPGTVLDIYSHCAWPERFTRDDIEKRRKKTRTLNYWDSQYQLEAKPINECRLDPAKMKPYAVQPTVERANGEMRMMLGGVRIISARCYWDCSLGKVGGDDSALSLILDDTGGNYYWHVAQAMIGEFAEFSDGENSKIVSGQVLQACDVIEKYQVPVVYVETNGVGTFVPKLLRKALKQRRLQCAVIDINATGNKNERILAGIEPPLKSGVLWAHVDVLDGPLWDQMKDWNPAVKSQPDDFIDSGSGAILQAPVRIGKVVGNPGSDQREDWRPGTGVHEVTLDMA
jgi:hypothetical protein